MIEPMSAATLFAESPTYPAATTIAGVNSTNDNITCALCARPFSQQLNLLSTNVLWSILLVLSLRNWVHWLQQRKHSAFLSNPPLPEFASLHLPSCVSSDLRNCVHCHPSLARSTAQSYSSPVSLSYSSSSSNGGSLDSQTGTPTNSQPTTIYPLCMSGWCLSRLRSTCTLWAFVLYRNRR